MSQLFPRLVALWRNKWRRRVFLAWSWMRASAPDAALPFGWCLITWAAFGWDRRLWAASIGLYCFVYVAVKFYEIRLTAAIDTLKRPPRER